MYTSLLVANAELLGVFNSFSFSIDFLLLNQYIASDNFRFIKSCYLVVNTEIS